MVLDVARGQVHHGLEASPTGTVEQDQERLARAGFARGRLRLTDDGFRRLVQADGHEPDRIIKLSSLANTRDGKLDFGRLERVKRVPERRRDGSRGVLSRTVMRSASISRKEDGAGPPPEAESAIIGP